MGVKVVTRGFKKEDENFIYATYLRNNWYSASQKTTLPKDTWMRLTHERLERAMYETPSTIRIACLSDDPDTILGYSLKSPERFTYIKRDWRGIGIEALLNG
jgi:hypothetical protein